MKKILRIFIMSALICFLSSIALAIANVIMNVHVDLDIYFKIACMFTVCLSICSIIYNSKKIFSKRKKVVRKVKVNTGTRRTNVTKRKIS